MWWGVCTATTDMYFPQVTAMLWYVYSGCWYGIFIPLSVKIEDALSCIALLAFECIHSMIGTLDIHPVHRACLTLHGIWFLGKRNHGLEDCFLLSRVENDKLVQGVKIFQMSVSLRGYFPHMLSFIVLGVWSKHCWRLWWFSPVINGVLWGPTQHIICSQDELTWSQRRQGILAFFCEHYTPSYSQNLAAILVLTCKLETNQTQRLKISQH